MQLNLIFILFILLACNEKINYPVSKKVDQKDRYFNTEISDPYRWLEDDNSDETKAWVQEQNQVTFAYLESISFRTKIKERLNKLWNYEKFGIPFYGGKELYYYKNDGLQNQYVLYKRIENGKDEIIIDPNKLSDDGTVSISGATFSKDGKYLAYQLSKSGSDRREIFIMEMEGRSKLADKIDHVKFSGITWYKDGFYYSRYPEPQKGNELKGKDEFQKLYYHKIGSNYQDDTVIFEAKESPNRGFYSMITDDERFLIIGAWEGTSGNALYVKDLRNSNSQILPIVENFENNHSVIGNEGDNLLIQTDYLAANNRLVKTHFSKAGIENWKDLIAEKEHVFTANIAGQKLFLKYIVDAKSKVEEYSLKAEFQRELILPGLGSVNGLNGSIHDSILYYSFTSFTEPSSIYQYRIKTGESNVYFRSKLDFNPADYESEQVFYKSKDGTQVPMFIVYKKNMKRHGKNPCYLYGYGGFNISLLPSFSPATLFWLEQGGIYAQANIRGGGEYGEKWHQAGTKLQKQNVFDDFIAASEFLIKEKYTSSDYLAIAGGSNGGLLVGACMTQRPDLFKVALPAVGVLDMLRYQQFTIGRAWSSDYGSSDESEVMFNYLLAYSPLHNLKDSIEYPATLITTADHDDRVVPAHSFKFAATLQEKHRGDNPVLIRIESKAGHGAGKPTAKIIEEKADIFSFIFKNMNINY